MEAAGCVLGCQLFCVAVRAGSPIQGAATAGVGRQHILQEVVWRCTTPSTTSSTNPHHGVLARLGSLSALLLLVIEQLGQEVDVLHGQAEDLILAELFVWGVRGDQLAELSEGPIHILLPPSLSAVGEDAPYDFGMGTWKARGQGLKWVGNLLRIFTYGEGEYPSIGKLGKPRMLSFLLLRKVLLILQSPVHLFPPL